VKQDGRREEWERALAERAAARTKLPCSASAITWRSC